MEDHGQPIPYLWTECLRVTGSSTCERDMYVWTGPVLVKDPPRVNETSTCEWILDKRLKFRRWFLHVLTRHKENYTCRLKLNLCLSQIECGDIFRSANTKDHIWYFHAFLQFVKIGKILQTFLLSGEIWPNQNKNVHFAFYKRIQQMPFVTKVLGRSSTLTDRVWDQLFLKQPGQDRLNCIIY